MQLQQSLLPLLVLSIGHICSAFIHSRCVSLGVSFFYLPTSMSFHEQFQNLSSKSRTAREREIYSLTFKDTLFLIVNLITLFGAWKGMYSFHNGTSFLLLCMIKKYEPYLDWGFHIFFLI